MLIYVCFVFSGFTPLILAATAGHVGVVEVLLDKGGDIEAQSERTKDTPLSLACSGGRQEVNTDLKVIFCPVPSVGFYFDSIIFASY